jgi:hypothetical protein
MRLVCRQMSRLGGLVPPDVTDPNHLTYYSLAKTFLKGNLLSDDFKD